jgi:TPR repeat protein
MYEHGQGVEEDESRALSYYVRAAKKGDAYAIKNRDVLLAHRAEHEAHQAALEAQRAAQEAHKPSK